MQQENRVRKYVGLPPDVADGLNEFRFSERIRTEGDAMLRLIEMGLADWRRQQQESAA